MTIKTLVIDIETAPNLAHVWGLWQQNVGINQIMKSGSVICWAAKWVGVSKVEYRSDFHDGHEVMVQRAHDLLSEADAVIHYNGTTFDIPWLKSEFVEAGLTPPAPFKNIDLLQVVKKNFRFPSNKLQYVSTKLGLAGKMQHSGHDLWVRALAGDPKAWATMKRYNVQDTRLTEELYERLLPWIQNHPHLGLYSGSDASVCQRCGSEQLQRRGWSHTLLASYPRLQCQGCGSWSRGKTAERTVDARGVQ